MPASESRLAEIFLQPGDVHFGDTNTRIWTVLGSCVSLTFWNARRRMGGMCHYMLPSRAEERSTVGRGTAERDGRYGDEAVRLLLGKMTAAGIDPRDCEIKLFGGGNMFPAQAARSEIHVGARNVARAHELLQAHGLECVAQHTGGVGHRKIAFDVWSGQVWVRHVESESGGCAQQEMEQRMCDRFA